MSVPNNFISMHMLMHMSTRMHAHVYAHAHAHVQTHAFEHMHPQTHAQTFVTRLSTCPYTCLHIMNFFRRQWHISHKYMLVVSIMLFILQLFNLPAVHH